MYKYYLNLLWANHELKSIIFIAIIGLVIIVCSVFLHKGKLIWLVQFTVSIKLIGVIGIMILIAGLSSHPRRLIYSIPFVIVYIIYIISLGILIITRLWNIRKTSFRFISIHLGLWLISLSLGRESFDRKEYLMPVILNKTEWRGYDSDHFIKELPIAIQLINLEKKEKMYAEVISFTKEGLEKKAVISVNNPLCMSNWKIYLDSYEETNQACFRIVSTSWSWSIYLGICLLGIGYIISLFKKKQYELE